MKRFGRHLEQGSAEGAYGRACLGYRCHRQLESSWKIDPL